MPLKEHIKKVLVIGSGPIIIGQAAEFDYAGTQACKAIKEEGLEVILVNSNPATIMTDANMADKVYIEPLTLEYITEIIEKERPHGLVPGLGGQTGLNMAVKLSEAGVLEKYEIELLGTPIDAIKKAEDREIFRQTMIEINEPIPESTIVNNISDAVTFGEKIGYPIIVRPAYTLGGTGGGIANSEEELKEITGLGLRVSLIGQVLLERSVAGWKEIEFEVMRDSHDNCIAICSMENLDPVGIHTGDSIVVAPTQTLNNKEFQMLRSASLKIIRELKVEGGCNVQFALDPNSLEYIVIEVNPRVSRSSALASKATGYPIAKMAAKIAVGLTLPEIKNPVTMLANACFEPAIDYIVVKVPRWPYDKFASAERKLGTQMKATGEVMAIDRSFEGGLMKAIRSLEIGAHSLLMPDALNWSDTELEYRLVNADDERIFAVAEALRRHWSVRKVHQLTLIDRWFLQKILGIVQFEEEIKASSNLSIELITRGKELGFSDYQIAKLKGIKAKDVRNIRKNNNIFPVYKMVDTCAGEFAAQTPYYYSTYEEENEVEVSDKKKIIVLGSGPIRIGQGIEFDYCSVHSAWALRDAGVESIIINNNPETVSTDFDISDKLYFEPLTLEDVLNIVELEKADGVVVQFGGQTAINLASGLGEHGIRIFGTSLESTDLAENREKFEGFLRNLGIPQSRGKTATKSSEAESKARELGYPVVVRPSYVIGGRAMEVVYNEQDLISYMENAVKVSPKHPVLIDKYIMGKEVEVDAISDGRDVLIPGIMEHIERAGIHSGDSMAVYPPQNLTDDEIGQIVEYTETIARALSVVGLLNIQYVIEDGKVYVLEVNPRASRTIPILSKVTEITMVKVATEIMLGKTLKNFPYGTGLYPKISKVIVKAPVFSFEKMSKVDISLGPEMKSTGEVMGIDVNFVNALSKAMAASGIIVPHEGQVLFSLADKDKEEGAEVARLYSQLGFKILATPKTAKAFTEEGLRVDRIVGNGVGIEEVIQLIKDGEIQLVINTPTKGKKPERVGFKLRQVSSNYRIPCLTSLDTATALVQVIKGKNASMSCFSLQEINKEYGHISK